MGKFNYILKSLNKRKPEEFLEILVRIGVLNKDRTLTDHYSTKKDIAERKSQIKKNGIVID